MKYSVPDAGGSWEHRGDTCKLHGDNVPHAKPYKSSEPFLCVQCMLDTAKLIEQRELAEFRAWKASR